MRIITWMQDWASKSPIVWKGSSNLMRQNALNPWSFLNSTIKVSATAFSCYFLHYSVHKPVSFTIILIFKRVICLRPYGTKQTGQEVSPDSLTVDQNLWITHSLPLYIGIVRGGHLHENSARSQQQWGQRTNGNNILNNLLPKASYS